MTNNKEETAENYCNSNKSINKNHIHNCMCLMVLLAFFLLSHILTEAMAIGVRFVVDCLTALCVCTVHICEKSKQPKIVLLVLGFVCAI